MPTDEPKSGWQPHPHKHFAIGERVLIQETNKRTVQDIKGRLATVTGLPGNGWVMAQLEDAADPPFRIQQRYLCRVAAVDSGTDMQPAAPAATASPAIGDTPLAPRPLKVRIVAPPSDARPSSTPGGGAEPAAAAANGATAGRADAAGGAAAPQGGQKAAPAVRPKSPGVATPGMLREVLRKLRSDMMDAESHVPWNAVHSLWRNKRATWRGKTRREETVQDLAARLSEFRSALKADASFLGCGATWQASLDACLSGSGSHGILLGVWEELRQAIGAWLDVRQRPAAQQTAALQARTARAVTALQRAAAIGQDAVAQVPLEAIVNNSVDGLQAVRAVIEKERKVAATELAKVSAAGADAAASGAATALFQPPLSPRNGPEAWSFGIPAVDFDSGADTDAGSGSCVTDMNFSSDSE